MTTISTPKRRAPANSAISSSRPAAFELLDALAAYGAWLADQDANATRNANQQKTPGGPK